MSELDMDAGKKEKGSALTRRSLVAAVGIVAAVSPLAAGKAMANWRPRPPFTPPSNGGGGSAQCFLSGTRILTPHGEVAIETLDIGDLVVTKDGTAKAIRWVGRMTFDREGQSWAHGVMPIRIQKGALGNGCPHRDLYLSRSHLLHLEGVLIPAGDLVNGTTIAAVDVDTDKLEYFHVELDQHDVLFAEGAACETLLAKAGHFSQFDNADAYVALYGALTPVAMLPCAPIVGHFGRRGALASRLRSALSPVIDVRNQADVIRDDLEARAFRAA